MRVFILVTALIFVGIFGFNNEAKATHVAGGYIQLICTGTPGQYIVRLTLYRDCSGIPLSTGNKQIRFRNSCGHSDVYAYAQFQSFEEVSQVCVADQNNTRCSGGTIPGFQEYIFEATVNLSSCDSWTASYSLAARNTITNVTGANSSNFYVTSEFFTSTDNCNTSPAVTAQPIPYVCRNTQVSYNLGASEPNGDSISYALVDAIYPNGNSLNYNGGASGAEPIPGTTINPLNGTVTYTPTQLGNYIFVIEMTEYDEDGNITTITNYEYQVYVIDCDNTPPDVPADIPGDLSSGVTNITGSLVQIGPSQLKLCRGFQGCFDVVFSDVNGGDVLSVTSNLQSVLPGAVITETGTNPLTVSVCWTPPSVMGVVNLSFLVEDDACPLTGQNNYAVTINVVEAGEVEVTTVTEQCGGTDQGQVNFNITAGEAPFVYSITGPSNQTSPSTSSTTHSFNNLPPGTYDYSIQTLAGCNITGQFNIVPGPDLPISVSATDVSCNGANDGSVTATPGGGVAPFNYVWTQGATTVGNAATVDDLAPGTYTVTVTDAAGCSTQEVVTVNQPNPLAASLTPVPADCFGTATGGVNVIGTTGGTAPYTYSINGGAFQAGNSFNGLLAGNHIVTIRDANGCTLTLNTDVTQPPGLNFYVEATGGATCGAATGSFKVNATGGQGPYTFTDGITTNSNGQFNNKPPGTYTISVTDGNGCTDDVTVVVDPIPEPIASIESFQNLSCFGGNDGQVIISVDNAANPLSYSLNGGTPQTSNQFTGLPAGTHSIEVTDANGCTDEVSVTITQPTPLTYTTTITPASCSGDCDGEIQVNASGGTTPYEYSSNSGMLFGSNSTLTGLCAGTVNLVVRDGNGCLTNSTEMITEPAGLDATFITTDPTCKDGEDGQVEVTVSGGTPAYLYSVNGGTQQPGLTLTDLPAGNHTIMVEDANGCIFTGQATLINPPGIDLSAITTPSNCGFNNGGLNVTATGVNAPFQYSYDNGAGSIPFQSNGNFTNLLAGAYQVYAMDALGCIDSTFFGINDIEMDGELLNTVDISCYGGNDGEVSVQNLAGAIPITFELDNSGVTETGNMVGPGTFEKTFTGLMAGSHIVTIYDDGLCVYTIPFTLTQPDEIDFSGNIADVSCFGGSDGEIEIVNVTGGTGAYQYSDDGGWTFDTNNQFGGFPAGTHTIYVMDENFCMIAQDFVVEEPTIIQVNTSLYDLSCYNDNTGVIQVFPTGGTPGYTYSIDGGATFQSSETFMTLSADSYDVVVSDANNCEMGLQVIIAEPDLLDATFTLTDTQCFGSCDGSITTTPTGGTTPYLYSIDGGTTINSTGVFNGVCANTYTVTVTDDNGCVFTADQTINEPTEITFTSVEVPSTCTDPNGEITISATGGTPGYNYSIDDGTSFQASNNFTGLMNGNYNLVVEDDNGCQVTGNQSVTDMPSPTIDAMFGTQPLCFGDSDGEIEVLASGGTGTIMYSVNGGAQTTNNILTGLGAGTHTVVIEDANGCTDTQDIIIDQPDLLTFTSTSTPLTCFQNSTGAIQVVATGGTPVFQYSFDNGVTYSSSPNLNFIDAGTYDIVVTDANGCVATGSQVVTEPTQLTFATISSIDNVCKSACQGEIELTVSGGTAPYSYDWTQPIVGQAPIAGANDNIATDLCAGTYTFVAIDNNGCEINDIITITEPDSVEISNVVVSNVNCYGDCDGGIIVNSPTATEFSIDGGASFQASNTFTGLCTGDYNIVARDVNGCIVEDQANIWQPEQLNATISNDTTVCYAYNLELVGTASGGVQPYVFNWNGATNGSSMTDTLHVIATQNETYTLDVIDDNGCIFPTLEVSVTVLPQVDITVMQDTTICPDGTAILTAQGSDGLPGYTYEWSTGETTEVISVSPTNSTTYTVTVTDACEDEATGSVDVNLFDLITPSFITDANEGCVPQTVTFTNTTDPTSLGGNCTWTIDGQQIGGCDEVTFDLLQSGCYDVSLEIETNDGCINSVTYDDFVCLEDYPIANFEHLPINPTVINNTINFSNTSVGASSYIWTATGQNASNQVNPSMTFKVTSGQELVTINVCLEAISDYGCRDTICKEITFQEEFAIYVPNTFTPDKDDYNETFLPVFPPNIEISKYHLTIYNRWGELLFESFDPEGGWRGTYGVNSGNIVKEGVYVWKISFVNPLNNEAKEYVGHVTLLK